MKNPLITLLESVVLVLLVPFMFNLSIFTGIGYLIALIGAFQSGALWRKKGIAKLIILGTFLAMIAGYLLVWALSDGQAGKYTSAGIILLVAVLIWYKANKMKKGKR